MILKKIFSYYLIFKSFIISIPTFLKRNIISFQESLIGWLFNSFSWVVLFSFFEKHIFLYSDPIQYLQIMYFDNILALKKWGKKKPSTLILVLSSFSRLTSPATLLLEIAAATRETSGACRSETFFSFLVSVSAGFKVFWSSFLFCLGWFSVCCCTSLGNK